MKFDCIDGCIQNGLKQPILFSFDLDKPSGYKVFCEAEIIHYKKVNRSVLNTITFYLGDENNEVVDFIGETLTFTLQMIKIQKHVYIHLYEYLYLCIHMFIRLFMYDYIFTTDNNCADIHLY